jgi:hypothetical protein
MIYYHKIDLYIVQSLDGIKHYVCLSGGVVIATAYRHSDACTVAQMYKECSPWPVEIHEGMSPQERQARRRHLSPSYAPGRWRFQ